jgi:diguanylate cyclase (GGDEF)-like protein
MQDPRDADQVPVGAQRAIRAQAPQAAARWRQARAGSGLTSRFILAYVERHMGRQGVEALLAGAGMAERERELSDENSWFSFEEKIGLWDAAVEVTGDRQVAERVGECAIEFSVGLSLKRALRALGSPDFVYRNVVRANSKFNWAHSLEVADRSPGRVRLEYRDVSGVGYHHYDCDYTTGLLRTVPQLFGLPQARVSHPTCGARNGDHCEFDVRWAADTRHVSRAALASGGVGGGLAVSGLVVDPILVEAGLAVLIGSAAMGALRTWRFMSRRIEALEARVRDQDMAAEAQLSSLATLSSDLRLDEVLERITTTATSAIGGAEFALLVADAEGMHANRHSGLPAVALGSLERWATDSRRALHEGPLVIDDLATVPALDGLVSAEELPLGSACAVPLIFAERLLGALIALAPGATVFLPHDVRALETYAGHAAIAFSNARLVDQLERRAAEDPLTRLANKRALQLACESELSRAARDDSWLSVVVLDLDHFKQINDRYGHPYGDAVLVNVAKALRSAVRGHDLVGRAGGEEFMILLPGTDPMEARSVAERARFLIGQVPLPEGRLSSSAGVSGVSGRGAELHKLLDAADRALYQAKRAGRSRTELIPVIA